MTFSDFLIKLNCLQDEIHAEAEFLKIGNKTKSLIWLLINSKISEMRKDVASLMYAYQIHKPDGLLSQSQITNKETVNMKEILEAFDRIQSMCVGVVGDDCKDDLVLLATKAGITEEVLRAEHPELYERGIDNVSEKDFAEENDTDLGSDTELENQDQTEE